MQPLAMAFGEGIPEGLCGMALNSVLVIARPKMRRGNPGPKAIFRTKVRREERGFFDAGALGLKGEQELPGYSCPLNPDP